MCIRERTPRVNVNGEPHPAFDGTLDQLIDHLGVHRRGIAVAIDGEIVPRSLWTQRQLTALCEIEIVTAAAGG